LLAKKVLSPNILSSHLVFSDTIMSDVNNTSSLLLSSSSFERENKPHMQPNILTCFPVDYSGPLLVLVSFIDNNIGKLHPVSLGKLFSKNFLGITNI